MSRCTNPLCPAHGDARDTSVGGFLLPRCIGAAKPPASICGEKHPAYGLRVDHNDAVCLEARFHYPETQHKDGAGNLWGVTQRAIDRVPEAVTWW